jgi:phenylalanine-4-hydroxylase
MSNLLKQAYENYTKHDQDVWKLLFDRQIKQLPDLASEAYIEGIELAGLTSERIPNFTAELNPGLLEITGWEVVVVPGLIPVEDFFKLMANRKFPSSTWLRTEKQLDYLEEPDMFHDTFGHVPLLTNQAFCDFLAKLSRIALKYIDNEEAVLQLQRLYWYTVEFGLIRENGKVKIYGGGILSSSGESQYSLFSDVPKRLDYDVLTIMETVVKIDEFQKQYFVIESYEQLYNSLPEVEEVLKGVRESV